MPHTLDELTEVMEERSARGAPSPDLLPLVRRRVRRDRGRRAVAGAAGAALVAGTFAGFIQARETGAADEAFPRSSPQEGMRPVLEVRYPTAGRKARFEFTPTGRHSMLTYRCSSAFMVFQVDKGVLSGGGCSENDGASAYLRTTPGVPVAFEVVALPTRVTPQGPKRPWTAAELDRFLAGFQPVPGSWSVRAYSGECTSETCAGPPDGRPTGGGRS
jgi:hypothetical protein